MRKLKFRIWYADEKRYLETPDGLFFKYPHSSQGGYVGEFIEGPYDSGEYIGDFITDPYFVEQFTNMLDVDGKEIYEGDVVKLIGAEGWSDNVKGAVGFYNGSYIIPDLDIALGDFKVQVAGNIHENPELLA